MGARTIRWIGWAGLGALVGGGLGALLLGGAAWLIGALAGAAVGGALAVWWLRPRGAPTPIATGAPVPLTPAQLEALRASGQPALVEFFSPTCPHCAALEPMLERLAQAAAPRVLVGQVDLGAHPQVAAPWGVAGTPTVVALAGGTEHARLTGVQGYRQYERALHALP